MKAVVFLLAAALLLSGCSDFWDAQGDAARSNAEARRVAAQAQRDNAQAAILDAKARGALADSQADALSASVDAVVKLATVDDKYATVFAALLFLVLGGVTAVAVLWAYRVLPVQKHEKATQKPLAVIIETPHGPVVLIQGQDESQAHFLVRVHDARAAIERSTPRGYLPK